MNSTTLGLALKAVLLLFGGSGHVAASSTNTLELALKKQRLQIASERLRADFGRYAAGVAPLFTTADGVVKGARWVRRNPQAAVAAAVALLVIRPKIVWRWARRAFVGWQVWRKLKVFLERHPPA